MFSKYAISILLEKMPDSFQRMVYDHPGAGESHHLAYPFPHVFPVAVRRAFLAGSLLLAVSACREPLVGEFLEFSAVAAEFLVAFLLPAVQSYHQGYRMLLSLDPACHLLGIIWQYNNLVRPMLFPQVRSG